MTSRRCSAQVFLEPERQSSHLSWSKSSLPASEVTRALVLPIFIVTSGGKDEQKAEELLASLVKQLAQSRSSLPESVKSLHDKHKDKRTRPSFDEISRALQSVAVTYSRVIIVVDALNECQASDGCRARLLSEIFGLKAKCGTNIFATSRFIPEITDKFEGSISLEIRASSEDVRRYLEGHMFRLPGFVGRSPELQEEIKSKIIQSVQGMYVACNHV
jgi:hypothetical protein